MTGVRSPRPKADFQVTEALAWAVVRRHFDTDAVFGFLEIAKVAGLSYQAATRIGTAWHDRGLVEEVAPMFGPRGKTAFRLKAEAASTKLAGRTPEQNMWSALRIQRALSPLDLASLADTDTVRVPVEAARAYCQMLTRAGYLKVVKKAAPDRGIEAVYRLIRNTGPQAPRKRRVLAIHDPNCGTTTPLGGVA